MSYNSIAAMANDPSLRARVTACAAQEKPDEECISWVSERIWRFCGTPGWAEAWELALSENIESPGRDEEVITDQMILSSVKAAA